MISLITFIYLLLHTKITINQKSNKLDYTYKQKIIFIIDFLYENWILFYTLLTTCEIHIFSKHYLSTYIGSSLQYVKWKHEP